MSDYIPDEIQIAIMKCIPIKSLIRFRSVSKSWKSWIDSSKFITDYNLLHTQTPQHLLVRYYNLGDCRNKHYLSVNDNDDDISFSEQTILSAPQCLSHLLEGSFIAGSSHGLLCLFGAYQNKSIFSSLAVIWNPTVRKSVVIDTHDVISDVFSYGPIVGFGVCPVTMDPKIVKMNDVCLSKKMEIVAGNVWNVEVFTLSSGVWRSKVQINHVPSNSISDIDPSNPVVAGGFIYWIASEKISLDNYVYMILSFDLTSEEFKKIYFPDEVTTWHIQELRLCVLNDSLVLVEISETSDQQEYIVWMMTTGFSKSFTKLFTVSLPYDLYRRVVGFRNNGQLIMETTNEDYDYDGDDKSVELVTYEHCSMRIKKLGIYGKCGSFLMSSFKESLLLLNLPKIVIGYEHDSQVVWFEN